MPAKATRRTVAVATRPSPSPRKPPRVTARSPLPAARVKQKLVQSLKRLHPMD